MEGGLGMAVSFEDVAVDFSAEEWQSLEGWQRRLYKEVMTDNVELVTSVGLLIQGLSGSKMIPEETTQLVKREESPRELHGGVSELNVIMKEEKGDGGPLIPILIPIFIFIPIPILFLIPILILMPFLIPILIPFPILIPILPTSYQLCTPRTLVAYSVGGVVMWPLPLHVFSERAGSGVDGWWWRSAPWCCGGGDSKKMLISFHQHHRSIRVVKAELCDRRRRFQRSRPPPEPTGNRGTCRSLSPPPTGGIESASHVLEKDWGVQGVQIYQTGSEGVSGVSMVTVVLSAAGTDIRIRSPCDSRPLPGARISGTQPRDSADRPYSCDDCHRSFLRKSHLTSHQRTHRGERPYACEVCGKSFHYRHHLVGHERIHTGEKLYSCEYCGIKFNHKGNYQTHSRLHTGERPFSCDLCGKSFNRKADLLTHCRIHTGERPFTCADCDNSFSRKKPFSCDQCRRSFVEHPHLRAHQKTHRAAPGERPFACADCGKGFSSRQYLSRHEKIHTGERPFRCDVCGDSFIQKPNLERHKGIHSGQRPHPCAVCGGSFFRKHNLVRHQRIHTGERLHFSCKVSQPVTSPQGGQGGCQSAAAPPGNPCKNVCCNRARLEQ
ncbi:PREDICTED: zinc finger protein 776-like [Nanorana parkeri]|uniref:zinc finger protein 776-like n=1 Tax=Nanorana parkeri TaxID=125878 RepID=UPI0008548A60|nr:PREDICTED: zinc finger protein 776-like [Nanorana parkeri]